MNPCVVIPPSLALLYVGRLGPHLRRAWLSGKEPPSRVRYRLGTRRTLKYPRIANAGLNHHLIDSDLPLCDGKYSIETQCQEDNSLQRIWMRPLWQSNSKHR